MNSEEKLLIEQLRTGDEGAYKRLFDQHYVRLVNVSFKILDDIDGARGCAQSVIVNLFEKRAKLDIRSSIHAYLNRAALNASINIKNKKQGTKSIQSDQDSIAEVYSDLLEESEKEARIWREIEALPDQCKKIFMMNRFEALSNEQIAQQLGISKRTVETQISNALKKLKKNLLIFFTLPL